VVVSTRRRIVARVVCASGTLVTLTAVVAVVGAGKKW
jgi:hypothetical protein